MSVGSVTVAILLHVPYVRRAGMWPFGEYQLYQAVADGILPLLDAVSELQSGGVAPRFTFALSPLLAEQLSDLLLRSGFEEYMLRRIADAPSEHKARDERLLDSFFSGHRRDVIRSLRELELAGAVECIGFPATGSPLPLLPRISARRAQVVQGIRTAERHLEHPIGGMWLPGGAVAPGAEGESIADHLVLQGVTYTFVGEKALRGPLVGMGGTARSALDPHRLSDGLVVLVRHDGFRTLIDAEEGGGEVSAGVSRAKALLEAHKRDTGRKGVLCLAIDVRRFCRWTDGPAWLAEFVRQGRAEGLSFESGAEAVHRHELQGLPDVTPSSWEGEGDFRVWQADNTTWYWESVAATLDHAESLADRFGGVSNPLMVRLLAQITREALLLVESEWPEMIGRGGEELDYAAERVREHLDRFRRLAYMLDTANPDELDTPLLERYEELDNPFEAIDLTLLASEPPHTARETGPGERPWSGMGPGGVI